ncbi:MAG TPA: DUF502 domain-containing protein [Planctomycetota bacterium]|nr:DUF502 domain-containing protein [Planctomycetota bacterium]
MTTYPSQNPQATKSTRMKRLLVVVRSNLIAGLLVAGPFYITIWILNWLYQQIDPPVQQFVLWLMRVNVDGKDLDGVNIAQQGLHRVHDWQIFPDALPTFLNLNYMYTFQGPKYQVIFGLGLLGTLVILLVTGFLTRTLIGRVMLDLLDGALLRIPVVNTIYSSLKQLSDTVFGKNQAVQQQKEVVLVEYPTPGSASIGFVTGVTKGNLASGAVRLFNLAPPPAAAAATASSSGTPSAETLPAESNPPSAQISAPPAPPSAYPAGVLPAAVDATSEELLLVFVPMSPLPTGGFLVVVPRSKVVKLDITVEQAFQLIVSGGIIQPNGATGAHAPVKGGAAVPAKI